MALHIRILASWLDRRAGSHLYHRELSRRLASRGYRLSLVCFDRGLELSDCAEIFQIPRPEYASTTFFWRVSPFLQYQSCTAQLRKISLASPDLVIGGEHLFLKAHWLRFPRTPWIYLPHSLVVSQEIQSYELPPTLNWAASQVYNGIQRWALNNADRTLRFTNYGCKALSTHYGASIRPRFTVNPMGIDVPSVVEPKPIAYPLKILWVGQLIPRKRIDVALNALASLRRYNWLFDIVGDGQSREALKRQTERLGLQDRVRFHGFQADPFSWYRAAHLLLFPSWLENSPVSMLEAMSCGVPCLAMRGDAVHFHNANAEIIDDGRDGFLAESDEHFGFQLERILKEPGTLREAGQAARQTIVSRHTWNKHLDHYESLFEELVHEKRHDRGRSRTLQRAPVSVRQPSITRRSRKNDDQRPPARRQIRVAKRPNVSLVFHHVLASAELGGAGLIALRLAKDLTRQNEACQIWIPGNGPAQQLAQQLGFPYNGWNSNVLSRSKLHSAFGNSQIAWSLRRYGSGIAHVHSPSLYGASQIGLRLSGLKRIVHLHLEDSFAGLRWAFKHPPDLIITCARYLVDGVRRSLPEKSRQPQRIVVVPNSIDTREYFPGNKKHSKQQLGLPGGVPLVILIANLAPHKGQETAIRAIAELKKRQVDVVCWLLGKERGGPGTYTSRLNTLINELGVSDRIQLMGYRYDTAEILRAADFLLLPSTREGLPLSVMEAQATKVPVLVSPIPGNCELVSDGDTGFLIPADDYTGYADTIQRLVGDEERYSEVAKRAYEQVKREHDWTVYCERIWALYSDVLGLEK
jgi:glycosyltransferase involved in cell wall biosynthesis